MGAIRSNQNSPMLLNNIYINRLRCPVLATRFGLVAADIELSFRSSTKTLTLESPINPNTADGLIQGALAELEFEDVFTLDNGVYEGFLSVRLKTRPGLSGGDPYYGIDFVELSVTAIGEEDLPNWPPAWFWVKIKDKER